MSILDDIRNQLSFTWSSITNQLTGVSVQVSEVNTSMNQIGTQTNQNAVTLALINTTVDNIASQGVSVDLTPVLNAIAAIQYNTTQPHLATLTDILSAINSLATGSTAPTWYSPPPSVPNTDDIAYAVWRWDSSNQWLDGSNRTLNMQQICEVAALKEILNQAWFGYPLPTNPWISFVSSYNDTLGPSGWTWGGVNTFGAPAVPDFSLWQAGDTVVSFLQRTQSDFGWTDTGPSGTATPNIAWKILGSPPFVNGYYRSNFDPLPVSTNHTVSNPPPPPPPPAPPAPPVVSDPTKHPVNQASINWSASFVHTAACDGLTFTCSEFSRRIRSFNVGDYNLYMSAGACTFFDADGNAEPIQFISVNQGVMLPRTMTTAAGFVWSPQPGLNGTVTPFSMVPN